MEENKGNLFSQIYLKRGYPLKDSEPFRRRLGAYCNSKLFSYNWTLGVFLKQETGVEIPFLGKGWVLETFFLEAELRRILDTVTLIWKFLIQEESDFRNPIPASAIEWRDFVSRVFHEENIGYQVDSECGVHYLVDEEFERNRFSTLSMIQSSHYNGVRAAFEESYKHMDSTPPDTKAAARSMFECIEILVKQMVETKNLNKYIVENKLKELFLQPYEGNATATKVTISMLDGFAKWVDGLHNYRHGQGEEEPVAPTEGIAIYILSSGSAFLRWLVGINEFHKK